MISHLNQLDLLIKVLMILKIKKVLKKILMNYILIFLKKIKIRIIKKMKEIFLKIRILKVDFLIKIIIVKIKFIHLLIDQKIIQILQIKNPYFLILLKKFLILIIIRLIL